MATKEVVCESCEASFTIEYELLDTQYLVKFCPFCSEELDQELVIQEIHDDEPYDIWTCNIKKCMFKNIFRYVYAYVT